MTNTFTTSILASNRVSLKGATFFTVTTLTVPKMNKRGNPFFGRVLKFAVRNCQFGYDYENAVNNRLEKEGKERSFKADSLPWGVWVEPNKIISHKGNLYGRFYVAKNCIVESHYIIDNIRLATAEEKAEIEKWVTDRDESATQSAVGLTDNQVKPWSINLDNVLGIVVNGCDYRREGYEQTEKALAK